MILTRLIVSLAAFVCAALAYLGVGLVAPTWVANMAAFWAACTVGVIGWFIWEVRRG